MTDYSWLKAYIRQQIEKSKGCYFGDSAIYEDGKNEAYQDILRLIKRVEEA